MRNCILASRAEIENMIILLLSNLILQYDHLFFLSILVVLSYLLVSNFKYALHIFVRLRGKLVKKMFKIFCQLTLICQILFTNFATVCGEKKNANGGGGGGNLADLLSGVDLGGLIDGLQGMLGKDGGKDVNKMSGELEQLKQLLTGLDPNMLKSMLGQLDTEQVTAALGNMLNPEDMWALMPEHLKNMLPESWFKMGKKLGIVLAKEWDKVAEVIKGLDTVGSLEEFWRELGKKAPVLAELLEKDMWKGTKKRWTKFEGKLDEEAKQYLEQVKSSGWEWLSRKVFVPALRLKAETKQNLKDSVAETFPLLKTVLDKAEHNEKLKEWAGQWHMMAELEQMFSKMGTMGDLMKNEEGEAEALAIEKEDGEEENVKKMNGTETSKNKEEL